MPLFNCPECNCKVSEEATFCPHCGKPDPIDEATRNAAQEKTERLKRKASEADEDFLARVKIRVQAAKKVSVAGINTRYVLPPVAIGAAILSTMVFWYLLVVNFDYPSLESTYAQLSFWILWCVTTYLLPLCLPCLANWKIVRPPVLPALGLLCAVLAFSADVAGNVISFFPDSFQGYSPSNEPQALVFAQNGTDGGEAEVVSDTAPAWADEDSANPMEDMKEVYAAEHNCWKAAMALQAVSLFLLTFTCLQFRAKLFGFLALPFALLFALTSGMNLSDTFYIFGGTDTGPGEIFPYFPYLFCTIGIIFCSIATMVDEKHRLDAATRSKARGLWPPEQ